MVTDDAGSNAEPPLPRRPRGEDCSATRSWGHHNALYGPKEEPPALVVEDDKNRDPGPIELHLDEASPKRPGHDYANRRPTPDLRQPVV